MVITHKISMDLEVKEPTKWIEIPRGEVNTRKIRLVLSADERPWIIPEKAAVLIRYRKKDGTEGEYDTLPDGTQAWTAAENLLTITLAPQVLTSAGSVFLYVSIQLEEQILNTFPVEIRVREGLTEDVDQMDASEDYFYMTRVMPGPDFAEVGQLLCVADVDSRGRVTRVEAVSRASGENGIGISAINITEV